MSVLTLFDDIQVNASEVMISPIDKLFCEQTKSQYERLVNQLKGYQRGLAELAQGFPDLNPATLTKYRSGSYHVEENRDEREDWTSEHAFSTAYSQLYISETLEKIKPLFIQRIIQYFNTKYNLDFALPSKETEGENLPENLTWEPYVDRIVNYAGGSLADAGIKNLIDAFRESFNYNPKDVTLRSNTISIQDTYLKNQYMPQYMDKDRKSTRSLLTAIGYFETGETTYPRYVLESFPVQTKIDHSAFVQANPLCTKFAGHKYFQNGRLDLKFHTAEAAREFHTMFLY